MLRLRRREWLLFALVLVTLFAVGYRFDVPRGLGLGSILYADRTDRMNALALGTANQRLGGGTTAPAYVDQNVLGYGSIVVAVNSTTTMDATQRAKFFYKVTQPTGTLAPYLVAPDTAGYVYMIWNSSGQTLTIKKSGGTGGTIASTKTGIAVHNGTDYITKAMD